MRSEAVLTLRGLSPKTDVWWWIEMNRIGLDWIFGGRKMFNALEAAVWRGSGYAVFLFEQGWFRRRELLEVRMQKRKSLGSSFSELLTRLELVTSSLPRKCSTTELQQRLLRRTISESGTKIGIIFQISNSRGGYRIILLSWSRSFRQFVRFIGG